jgi:hypothetical protein
VLVAGLVAGLALPEVAQAMRPWLPQMVAGLLFITALRVGYHDSVGQIRATPGVFWEVLILQLALPVCAATLAWALGLLQSWAVIAVVLMLAAPSITGSPNFSALLGRDPAPAMQILVVGTALFPVTMLPVAWMLSDAFGPTPLGLGASLSMVAVILVAVSAGFGLRARILPKPDLAQTKQLEGLGVLALALIVIGLMAGIRPVLDRAPLELLGWLALVFAANFGLQVVAFRTLPKSGRRVPLSLIAGNRNVALFLLVLPDPVIAALLPFIGCYQLPMYLTPLLMARLYRAEAMR